MSRNILSSLILCFTISLFASLATASTSLTYEYDANGNLISDGGQYYEYNDANQLVRVRHGDASGPILAEYFYDYTGQRIKKVEDGVTTYYIGKHYEKQSSETGSATTSYYFANGERVAKKDSIGNISYNHSDHLGGTNVITDSSGNLVERIRYYPFGEIREGGNERYSFTGKEKDNVTDYYYFEARYYNPEFKHFTQADTIEPNYYDPQDLNRYAYVRNNPIKFVDPTGHSYKFKNEEDKKQILSMLSRIETNSKTGERLIYKLNKLTERKDIEFVFENLGNDLGGYAAYKNKNTLLLVLNAESSQNRMMWSFAHEIQHIVDFAPYYLDRFMHVIYPHYDVNLEVNAGLQANKIAKEMNIVDSEISSQFIYKHPIFTGCVQGFYLWLNNLGVDRVVKVIEKLTQ